MDSVMYRVVVRIRPKEIDHVPSPAQSRVNSAYSEVEKSNP